MALLELQAQLEVRMVCGVDRAPKREDIGSHEAPLDLLGLCNVGGEVLHPWYVQVEGQ